MGRMSSGLRTVAAIMVAWALVAGLLVFEFHGSPPQSVHGWLAFLVLGPPLYFLVEWLGESLGEVLHRSSAVKAVSSAGRRVRVASALLLGLGFVYAIWWLNAH